MPPSGPKLPPKKEVALALLERASVFVHLDPRSDEVRVPKWFKKQPQLVLQIGLNMPVPIPDLSLEDDAISCTLSFSRSPFFCFVPWSAVYALVGEDGRGMVWPDDVPKEVAAQSSPRKEAGPGLRVVEDDERPEESDAADAPHDGGGEGEHEPVPVPEGVADLAKRRSSRPAPPQAVDGPEPAAAGAESLETAQPPRPALAPVEDGGDDEPGSEPDPPPDPKGGSDRKKRKRDLPPYLRIVK